MTHLFFVSIWVHWGAAFSLEAWFRRTVLRVARPGHPKVPAWQLGVLQALFCLPYFWGGVAKLNRDWLLRAQPVTGWFSEREGFPYDHWAFPWFICWGESGATQRRERRWRRKADARCRTGGCAFDLTISFLLTHRDDRVRYGLGFPGAIFFNVSNKLMLNIGVFPYMMLISLALFIKPEHWELVVDAVVPTGPTPTAKEKGKGRGAGGGGPRHGLGREQKALLGSLAIFAAFEMLNPLRHFFYRSNVSWTEEGHIGAWHMKLRTKNGATVFQATTRAGDVYFLAPQVDPLLQTPGMRPKLKWIIQTRPWASLTYVAHLQRVFAAAGQELVKVQAHSCMALNYQARYHPLFIAEANLLDFIPRKVRGGRNPFAVLCSGTDPPPPPGAVLARVPIRGGELHHGHLHRPRLRRRRPRGEVQAGRGRRSGETTRGVQGGGLLRGGPGAAVAQLPGGAARGPARLLLHGPSARPVSARGLVSAPGCGWRC